MARGNNLTLASGTGRSSIATIPNVDTVLVLNPNNGILYVKINGAADPVNWDWVVPSQSRAYLPGPWIEYGLHYVDQSGAGSSGNVTVYESQRRFDVPDYAAIGVARLAQQTSMDVTEGTIPANPGAGIARLWVSSTGVLHILLPDGTDYAVPRMQDAPLNIALDFEGFGTWIRSNAGIGNNLGDGLETYYNAGGVIEAVHRPFAGSADWRPVGIAGSTIGLTANNGDLTLSASGVVLPGLSRYSAFLGSTVNLNTSNTQILTLALPAAGLYRVWGTCLGSSFNTTNAVFTTFIRDTPGSTQGMALSQTVPIANGPVSLSMTPTEMLFGSAVTLEMVAKVNVGTAIAYPLDVITNFKGTFIMAERIA